MTINEPEIVTLSVKVTGAEKGVVPSVMFATLSLVKSKLAFTLTSEATMPEAKAVALALEDVPKLSTVVVSVATLSCTISKLAFISV